MKNARALFPPMVALLVLLVGACAADTTNPTREPRSEPPTFDLAEAQVRSCGDAAFYLFTPDGSMMLRVVALDLSARAAEAGSTITERHDVAGLDIDVVLQIGEHLEQDACNDAIEFEPVVQVELLPVGGSFVFTVTPQAASGDGDPMPATVTMRIESLEFESIRMSQDEFEFGDLQIGWFVG